MNESSIKQFAAMTDCGPLKQQEALSCIAELKKILICRGQYLDVTEQYRKGGLKFYKIEASIMVKE